ncbi:MAG: hypothetical protein ABIR70_03795 [Bryobacteraceae bacterium]
MRCLYCNKELALLKRLTGGAEFCSDAHRKKYQEEFNDLALSRLLQTPTAPAAPLPVPEPVPEEPKIVPPPVAVAPPRPRSTQPASSPGPTLVANPTPRAERAKPTTAQKKDPAIASYLIEQPVGRTIDAVVPDGLPPFAASVVPELPSHLFQAMPVESGFSHASRIPVTLTIERRPSLIRPRDGNLEIREFSRQAVTPTAPPQQTIRTNDTALSSAFGEAMEITNQPRPPADPPMIWQAGPQPAPAIDLLLGDLSRLDFASTGFGEDVPPEHAPRATQPFANAPAVASVDPVAAPPVREILETVAPRPIAVPQPVVAAQPSAAPIPAPVTASLPITLHGSGADPAKPTSIISAGLSSTIEPQVPPSSALPLRPTMVLAPRQQAVPQPTPVAAPAPIAAPVPKPVAAAPAPVAPTAQPAPVANTSVVRPVRGPNGKIRRPEVRVVQTSGQAAGQPLAQPAPAAPAPTATVPPAPVQAARVPTPVAQAPAAPVKSNPAPQAAPPSAPARAAAKTETPRPAPKPELDLHLPELHNPEVLSPWAKLPGAAKAGIGAVLALAIVGVAYTVFNGSNASATPTANLVPAYNLGKQINSGGWIEDWAPADTFRRITLLRGSQPYSDYRIEFQAQIQNKAIGWMYRGLNPKNFYVVKLEKIKSGLDPVVQMVRYAVIDGDNEKRVEKVLPLKVRVDTSYKIRFDAVGTDFTLWVQNTKIDEWHDSRLGSGGVGLYSEGEEASSVNGTVNVYELVSTK